MYEGTFSDGAAQFQPYLSNESSIYLLIFKVIENAYTIPVFTELCILKFSFVRSSCNLFLCVNNIKFGPETYLFLFSDITTNLCILFSDIFFLLKT